MNKHIIYLNSFTTRIFFYNQNIKMLCMAHELISNFKKDFMGYCPIGIEKVKCKKKIIFLKN